LFATAAHGQSAATMTIQVNQPARVAEAVKVQIDIGTVEVVRLALRGASGRSATRPTSMPKLL
jgi:hypothetical protein